MKLSIIISVLNSPEIFRRQLIHWTRMNLPDEVEFIILDDGSDVPLKGEMRNLIVHPTNDKRSWTVELARNLGARMARGEYLLMTDIDYIIPRDAIESALTLTEDKMRFKRQFGVLDENGDFTQDFDVLRKYGLLETRIEGRGTNLPPHPNNFVMRKETFWKLGGYREDLVDRPYPNKGDTYFKRTWAGAYDKGQVTMRESRPTLFMFPNGQYCGDVDFNPLGLFHDLSRKTTSNHWYMNPRS
jgi:glycosyltransferase involved in cell wall biosynthesis